MNTPTVGGFILKLGLLTILFYLTFMIGNAILVRPFVNTATLSPTNITASLLPVAFHRDLNLELHLWADCGRLAALAAEGCGTAGSANDRRTLRFPIQPTVLSTLGADCEELGAG
jgi:hypothetical protein